MPWRCRNTLPSLSFILSSHVLPLLPPCFLAFGSPGIRGLVNLRRIADFTSTSFPSLRRGGPRGEGKTSRCTRLSKSSREPPVPVRGKNTRRAACPGEILAVPNDAYTRSSDWELGRNGKRAREGEATGDDEKMAVDEARGRGWPGGRRETKTK